MIKLTLFEMKKVFKSTSFRFMLFFISLLLIGYYVFVYIHTVRTNDLVAEYENRVHQLEEHLGELRNSLSNDKENKELIKEIEFQEKFLEKDKMILKAYQEEDWTTILNADIELDEPGIKDAKARRDYYTSSHPTLFTNETRIEQYKWLRDRSIEPVWYLDFISWYTVYDIDFGDPIIEEIIKERSNKYSSAGIYYLNHVFNQLFGVIGALFFILLFGNMITKEGLGKNGPIHLLHTQPIPRYKILGSKWMASVTVSLFILLAISLFSILMGTIFDRFGDVEYPVLIYGEDYTHSFMEMGTYLLKSALLFFMILLFCYSILFLFSLITKRTLLAVGLTLAVILIGIQWSGESTLSAFAPYVPFHYFSVSEIITNEFAVTIKNFDFSYTNGLIVLGIYSFCIFLLTYLLSILQNKFSH